MGVDEREGVEERVEGVDESRRRVEERGVEERWGRGEIRSTGERGKEERVWGRR